MIKRLLIHDYDALYMFDGNQLLVANLPEVGEEIEWSECCANLGMWSQDEKINRWMADVFIETINREFIAKLTHADFPGR